MNKKWIIFTGILFVSYFLYLIIFNNINLNLENIPSSLLIYDTNGIEIGEIVKDGKYRHREGELNSPAPLAKGGYRGTPHTPFTKGGYPLPQQESPIGTPAFPEFLVKAIVLLEDKSFYSNNGISFKALIRSTINNLKSGKIIEGGSTISSQLIRNSYGLNEERTLNKKIKEFVYALALNKQYSKNEILEKYLNILYFGYLNYGFESAAQFYFGKSLNNLTKAEQIALITIPKNSNKYDPIKKPDTFYKRYYMLIDYFYKNELYDENEYNEIKNEKLIFVGESKNKLPYVVDYLNKEVIARNEGNEGRSNLSNSNMSSSTWIASSSSTSSDSSQGHNSSIIQTTIDYDLSNKINNLAFETIKRLQWKSAEDYGILIADRKTNEIKVMIGGVDYYGKEGQVNSITALRQPGSSLKPFTYALAFKNLGLNPGDTITDLPVQYETSQGYSYTPKNFSLKYKGEVTLANALAESLNVPAVKLLEKIGTDNLLKFLKQVGITSLDKNAEFYGLSLTLGSGEVSLYELLQAYTIFANDGKLCKLSVIASEAKQSRNGNCATIIEKQYIDNINLILTNRYFKINGFPINSNLDFEDREVFVKTGTSRDFRDNIAIGFTENYMIGVWVGNKDGSEMKMISGTTGAGEIFRKIVYELEPNKIETKPINLEINKEKYIEITSPTPGSKFKIDNSKPIENQKIKLELSTNYEYTNVLWLYDNQKVEGKFITPIKGKHEIKVIIFDGGEKVGEGESRFEVF